MTLASVAKSRLLCGSHGHGTSHNQSESERGRSKSRGRSRSKGRTRSTSILCRNTALNDEEEFFATHVGELPSKSCLQIIKKKSHQQATAETATPTIQEDSKTSGIVPKQPAPPRDLGTTTLTTAPTTSPTKDSHCALSKSASPTLSSHDEQARTATQYLTPKRDGGKDMEPIGSGSKCDDSIVNLVAYYVDHIPDTSSLCWHLLETNTSDVYVPVRICVVKSASQQTMIDDLGFLKGGRYRVVPSSELVPYAGDSTKREWCPKFMKEYLEFISKFHSSAAIREEVLFLNKILRAVKVKEPGGCSTDEESEKPVSFVEIHSGTTEDESTVGMELRDDPETTLLTLQKSKDAFNVPTARPDARFNYSDDSYFPNDQQRSVDDSFQRKHEAHVKFTVNSDEPQRDAPESMSVGKETQTVENNGALDATTWWIILRGSSVKRGATPLVNRCIRAYGWSESFATRVLAGYKQFCAWKLSFEDWDDSALAPPVPIRKMWQQHLLDSHNYQADCILLFGKVLHYNPDNGADTDVERERIDNTRQIAHVRFKGADYDKDVWSWEEEASETLGDAASLVSEPKEDIEALLQEARKELKPVPKHTDNHTLQHRQKAQITVRPEPSQHAPRPYTFRAISSPFSDTQSTSNRHGTLIRLRIVGNGKNGLRSASVTMEYTASFDKSFSEYAGEYAIRIGKPRVSLRFQTKDGRRIVDSDTPEKLRLLNNDEIIVMQPESEQRGPWI